MSIYYLKSIIEFCALPGGRLSKKNDTHGHTKTQYSPTAIPTLDTAPRPYQNSPHPTAKKKYAGIHFCVFSLFLSERKRQAVWDHHMTCPPFTAKADFAKKNKEVMVHYVYLVFGRRRAEASYGGFPRHRTFGEAGTACPHRSVCRTGITGRQCHEGIGSNVLVGRPISDKVALTRA